MRRASRRAIVDNDPFPIRDGVLLQLVDWFTAKLKEAQLSRRRLLPVKVSGDCLRADALPYSISKQLTWTEIRRFNLPVTDAFANSLTTRCMLAPAANLHHTRSLGILAIFAAILAAFLGRTITSSMRALT
jgi:hypothetical protein